MRSELEQLRAENEQLKLRQEKILRLFATNIPVELRIPVNSIQGLSDLIKKDSGKLTAEQLDYLNQLQSANNHMARAVDFVADYARYGFTKPSGLQPSKLAGFKIEIIKPIEEYFGGFGTNLFKIAENFSVDSNFLGILVSQLAIQKALNRIFRELFCYYAIDQIQISLSDADGKFFVQITAPRQLRAEPLFRSIYQNHYDQGHIDWAVEAIIELYDGELQFGVVDRMIEIVVSFPLVEMEAPNEN